MELIHGENLVEVGAFNDQGIKVRRARWSAVYRKPVKGNLYFIGFGASRYRNPDLNLQFAHKDVLHLAQVLRRYDDAFNRVFIKTYTDDAVTLESIEEARRLLCAAHTDDTVVATNDQRHCERGAPPPVVVFAP